MDGKSLFAKSEVATGAVPSTIGADSLCQEILVVLDGARTSAYRAVNFSMVRAYWHVGRLIVEHEQEGNRRAPYGDALLRDLSKRLTREIGRGYTVTNLRYMRQFYVTFPAIHHASRDELLSGETPLLPVLRPELTWTHYRLLLGVADADARQWYMNETAEQHWSTRQLERQISVLYYERLLSSRDKGLVRIEAADKTAAVAPERSIRDPYVLEFLDLKEYPALRESVLEQGIIDNLQAFLLELGKGFSFVARQKCLRMGDEDFYIDLVFYNYILKLFALIDLKIGKLTHQDIGQMDSYVRMFDAHVRTEGDNPTIGLILCSTKNEAIAKYSVLAEGRQVFAAKYLAYLPTEEELMRELMRERQLIEALDESKFAE